MLTDTGARIPGLRFGDPRAHALLQALPIHRLLPHGFTNRDLRTLIAPLLGTTAKVVAWDVDVRTHATFSGGFLAGFAQLRELGDAAERAQACVA